MSTPSEPEKVKLITSLFSPQKDLIDLVIREMESIFGPVDWKSRDLFFDRTKYYAREMGWPLFRRFISFKDLIRPEALIEVKLKTNQIEERYIMLKKANAGLILIRDILPWKG